MKRFEFSRPEKDMAAMTATELEQLQVQWYAEATMRGVLPIIATVARELGRYLSVRYGPKYEWHADSPDGEITVYVDDYGGYFTVEVRGKRVVSTHADSRAAPGGDRQGGRAQERRRREQARTPARDARRVQRMINHAAPTPGPSVTAKGVGTPLLGATKSSSSPRLHFSSRSVGA